MIIGDHDDKTESNYYTTQKFKTDLLHRKPMCQVDEMLPLHIIKSPLKKGFKQIDTKHHAFVFEVFMNKPFTKTNSASILKKLNLALLLLFFRKNHLPGL